MATTKPKRAKKAKPETVPRWHKGRSEEWDATYDGPGSVTYTHVMEEGQRHPVCIVVVKGIDDAADVTLEKRVSLICAAPAMYAKLVKVADYCDRLAEQAKRDAENARNFPSLQEANRAAEKNWRATAADIRSVLPSF